jgi:hypothetical protein
VYARLAVVFSTVSIVFSTVLYFPPFVMCCALKLRTGISNPGYSECGRGGVFASRRHA